MKLPEETVERQLSNQKQKIGKEADAGKKEKASNFQDAFQEFSVIATNSTAYREFLSRVDDSEIVSRHQDKNFYEVTFTNDGGLVTPIIVEFTFADGTKEVEKIPAEIWRKNEQVATKVFVKDKEVVNISLDPYLETADVEAENNHFPRKEVKSKFQQFKEKQGGRP